MWGVNSQFGRLENCINEIDVDIPVRMCIDETVSKQGKILIDILKDTKCCVVNGRINGNNNFTSVLVKGRAVVDYIITTYNCLRTSVNLDILQIN